MLSLEEIIREIIKSTKMKDEEVKRLIEDKQDELSGLVSPEGAAYIVAKELGVNLLRETARDLKIKNIVSGMRSVDLAAKVLKVFETRNFTKNGREGRVRNILIGDETGSIRFSLWDKDADLFGGEGYKESDTISVKGGFVIEDNRGNLELRLGKKGRIKRSEKEIEAAEIPAERQGKPEIRSVIDFRDGDFVRARAAMVQIFPKKPFYEVCPNCDSRVEKGENTWACKEHGEVKDPKYQLVVSGFMDDGTGSIRAVFFRDVAEKLIKKSAEDVVKMFLQTGNLADFFEKLDVLGKEFMISGRVKTNQYTENLELIVNDVDEVNVKQAIDDVSKLIEKSGMQ